MEEGNKRAESVVIGRIVTHISWNHELFHEKIIDILFFKKPINARIQIVEEAIQLILSGFENYESFSEKGVCFIEFFIIQI